MSLDEISSDKELLASLRLIRSENIGIKSFYSLLKYYGSALEVVRRFDSLGSAKLSNKPARLADIATIERELESLRQIGAGLLHFESKQYPWMLKLTVNPPPFLTYLGNISLLEREALSIVGSRNASINGMNFTRKIVAELGTANFVSVSGLARGIDSVVHQSSLATGTIAVIAGGIDHIYPPENAKLYWEIAEKGLILAENPSGTVPMASNFPQRNRIISGLSIATLVIEASLKSGSLITARYATEQGRHVFAVPGFPMDYRYSGTNYLLKQGAILTESAQDVIDHLQDNRFKQLHELTIPKIEEEIQEAGIEVKKGVEEVQDLILSSVGFSPTSIEDLAVTHNLSIDIIQIAILELELAEKIVKSSNNTITLVS